MWCELRVSDSFQVEIITTTSMIGLDQGLRIPFCAIAARMIN